MGIEVELMVEFHGLLVVIRLIDRKVSAVEGCGGLVEAIHTINVTLCDLQSIVSHLQTEQQLRTIIANPSPIADEGLGFLTHLLALTDGLTQVCLVVIAICRRREIIDIPVVALKAESDGGFDIAEVVDNQIGELCRVGDLVDFGYLTTPVVVDILSAHPMIKVV